MDSGTRGTESLEWRAHLFVSRPARSAVVVAVVASGVLVVQLAFGRTALTVLSLILVVGALSQFFFPLSYRLTDRGVTIRHLGSFTDTVSWEDLTGYRHLGDCLLLLRRRRKRKGGILLYFRGNGENVIGMVNRHLPRLEGASRQNGNAGRRS